ncbi:hypothetical protein FQN53_001568 [Emmonsiellopsis sp. PD_33]|nr:hypothetical protein FQN53_001568 [Emmonsiellopsis sp. PD_33]
MSSRNSANERSSNGPIRHQSQSNESKEYQSPWFGSQAHEANSGRPIRGSLSERRSNTTTPDANSIPQGRPSENLTQSTEPLVTETKKAKPEEAHGKESERPKEQSNHGHIGKTGELQAPAKVVYPPCNGTQNRRHLNDAGLYLSRRR